MIMSTIAVDIDQTLYDFDSEVREAFFEMAIERGDKSLLRGAYSGFNEWRELSDSFDWPIVEEAIDRVHDQQYYQKPFKNSARILRRLDEHHKIKYVTSRKEHFYDDTYEWLGIQGYPDGELFCSGHDKGEFLKDCRYLIDDRPRTIFAFLSDYKWTRRYGSLEPRKAFGLWTPYNRNFTDIPNLYLAPTWRGLEFYLERKELL